MEGKRKNELILLLVFWIVFILIYTYRLTAFPIFEDEAIHLLMSEWLFASPVQNLFIFMNHYFLPGFGWLYLPFRLLIHDSLLAGRFMNALLSSTLFFWLYLVKRFFKLPLRFFVLSSLLLLFSPILFLNSRIALLDTAVMVLSLWSLFLFWLVIKKPKFIYFTIFFFVFLICLLIKFTSLFIVPSLIYLLWHNFRQTKSLKNSKNPLLVLIFSGIIFLLIIYPFFFKVSDVLVSGSVTVLKIGDILAKVDHNFWLFINWAKVYYPYLPLSIVSFAALLLTKRKSKGYELMAALLLWCVISFLAMVGLDQYFYPRHILIILVPVITIPIFILLKYSLKISLLFILVLLLLQATLFKDLVLDSTFTKAQMAKEDYFQYFEDYTSGINIGGISDFISKKAVSNSNQTITVYLDGTWVMEYGLRRALKGVPNLVFKSFVDFESQRYAIIGNVWKDSNKLNYIVINKNWPLNKKDLLLVQEFKWGGYHPEYIYVFK